MSSLSSLHQLLKYAMWLYQYLYSAELASYFNYREVRGQNVWASKIQIYLYLQLWCHTPFAYSPAGGGHSRRVSSRLCSCTTFLQHSHLLSHFSSCISQTHQSTLLVVSLSPPGLLFGFHTHPLPLKITILHSHMSAPPQWISLHPYYHCTHYTFCSHIHTTSYNLFIFQTLKNMLANWSFGDRRPLFLDIFCAHLALLT